MKKLTLLAALIAGTAGAAPRIPVHSCLTSKWFVGLDAGCIIGYFNPKNITTDSQGFFPKVAAPVNFYIYRYDLASTRPAWGTPGITALLNFGYDYKFNDSHVVLGFFAGGGISKTSAFLPSYAAKDSNGFGTYNINAPVNMSTSGRFQAGLRLGTDSLGWVLPVFTLGWSIFKTKAKISRISSFYSAATNPNWNNTYVTYSVGNWTNCLMVGFGLEFNLTSALILGFSSNVHIGGSPKYSFTKSTQFTIASTGTVDRNISMKVHPVLVEVLANVKYAFPTSK